MFNFKIKGARPAVILISSETKKHCFFASLTHSIIKNYNLPKQGFILSLAFILFFGAACVKSKNADNLISDNILSKPMTQRLIDGVSVEKFQENLLPVAVIVDNFTSSRPPSGLNAASIIYEAPVEAGITRFLAIFDLADLPEKIGPVRSARPYFLDLAEEYQALLVHAGGSPESLKRISKGYYKIYNLDEISADGIYFWRDYSRIAPFNLYTSKSLIERALNKKNLPLTIQTNFNPWQFFVASEKSPLLGQEIKIGYLEGVFWRYDAEKNQYLRFFSNGQAFIDEAGEQIKATNLIIQKTRIEILDEIGRRAIDLESGGGAIIFLNGQRIDGTWRKINNRTKFYDLDNQEIKFLPGNFWIEIVSETTPIQYQYTTAG